MDKVSDDVLIQFLLDCKDFGFHINDEQLKSFETYYRLLIEWNNKINLTSITEKGSVFTKHFLDSLLVSLVKGFNPEKSLLDVGAGAGFPSIPLKISCSNLSVSILDSLNKRISFLSALCNELSLDSCVFYHGRAEDLGQDPKMRECYEQVTARAVARLPVLGEFCLPFVKVGGYFFALKGPDVMEEVNDAKGALKKLGGNLVDVVSFRLPRDEGDRNIIVIEKKYATPRTYPRKPGIPGKLPLI